MKTSKTLFRRKASAFLGAAAVLLAAVFAAGCNVEVSHHSYEPETLGLAIHAEENGRVDARVGTRKIRTGAKLKKRSDC